MYVYYIRPNLELVITVFDQGREQVGAVREHRGSIEGALGQHEGA